MRLAILVLAAAVTAGGIFANPLKLFAQTYGEIIPFESLTLPSESPLNVTGQGTPVTIWGYLRLPNESSDRVPAIILTHGCGGIGDNTGVWMTELNRIGVATFVLDSFTPRGIKEICTGRQRISTGSMLPDVYGALALLASNPRIDPHRIGLMGFSFGGRTTVWASEIRFQRAWMPPGNYQFAAYLAFYPVSCYVRLYHEEEVVDRPIRIFHGTADDWTPVSQCRQYVDRMRQAGKDVALIEYLGAHHAFDRPGGQLIRLPDAISPRQCTVVEIAEGQFVYQSGRPFTLDDPCLSRGATVGGNDRARLQAVQDVTTFLRQLFKLGL